jgi:hypothetical protein
LAASYSTKTTASRDAIKTGPIRRELLAMRAELAQTLRQLKQVLRAGDDVRK